MTACDGHFVFAMVPDELPLLFDVIMLEPQLLVKPSQPLQTTYLDTDLPPLASWRHTVNKAMVELMEAMEVGIDRVAMMAVIILFLVKILLEEVFLSKKLEL